MELLRAELLLELHVRSTGMWIPKKKNGEREKLVFKV
jgi:hypothetical protein